MKPPDHKKNKQAHITREIQSLELEWKSIESTSKVGWASKSPIFKLFEEKSY